MWQRYRKYKSVKIDTPDGTFDSKREYKRWMELQMMERNGYISDLRRQVPFELIPAIKEPDTVGPKGGIKKGRTIQKACMYVADFVYDQDGKTIVEDAKGFKTKEFLLKAKILRWRFGIDIKLT